MAKEIERKFLVDRKEWNALEKPVGVHYNQGYLSISPSGTVRVRITDSTAFITIKGKSKGATRDEFEYEIPMDDANQMMHDLVIGSLNKIRYKITFQNKLWEVDQFLGKNEGLLLAEIELKNEEEDFIIPEWVDIEVTEDERYYNSNLVMNPYQDWKK